MVEELYNLSPIDGRYREDTEVLKDYFSEYALIKNRVMVELDWFFSLAENFEISGIRMDQLGEIHRKIQLIKEKFDLIEAKKIKMKEATTKHDVKAVEYYIRDKFEENGLAEYEYLIHFGLTSEDVNNLAYGRMINGAREKVLNEKLEELLKLLRHDFAEKYKSVPMLSHTHGQKATPTTVGKEFAVFHYRLNSIYDMAQNLKLKGKCSGAVGTFSAFEVAFPNVDWFEFNCKFVENQGLEFNPLTTQIESHDMICTLFSYFKLIGNILLDLNLDMWTYISMNYFKQIAVPGEVGSSVMPHKVNPINFENSMANLRMANSIWDGLVNNLEVSRMQRDLSDSSMLRNIGTGFGYWLIAINSLIKGLKKVEVNEDVLKADLETSPEVLAEAIQTVLRKNKMNQGYEILKEATRGKEVHLEDLRELVQKQEISEEDKNRLLELEPKDYTGIAEKLCKYM